MIPPSVRRGSFSSPTVPHRTVFATGPDNDYTHLMLAKEDRRRQAELRPAFSSRIERKEGRYRGGQRGWGLDQVMMIPFHRMS